MKLNKSLIVIALSLATSLGFASPSFASYCNDGTFSTSSGRGTCSWHGGLSSNDTFSYSSDVSSYSNDTSYLNRTFGSDTLYKSTSIPPNSLSNQSTYSYRSFDSNKNSSRTQRYGTSRENSLGYSSTKTYQSNSLYTPKSSLRSSLYSNDYSSY